MTHQLHPRPASSVLLVRETPRIEVLMVERVRRGFFGGLMVFPGGAIDPCDQGRLTDGIVVGAGSDVSWRAAALRELAEETGIALTSDGLTLAPNARGGQLYSALGQAGLTLDADRLTFVSRWITPEGAPSRFDTKFYMADISGDPEIRLDRDELEKSVWIGPARALERGFRGKWKMFAPTVAHLAWLASHESVRSAVADAVRNQRSAPVQPRAMDDWSIVSASLPGCPP